MSVAIEFLQAGAELNAHVAVEVMGWEPKMKMVRLADFSDGQKRPWHYFVTPDGQERRRPPEYSTDPAAAWEVVEKLSADYLFILWQDDRGWNCRFTLKTHDVETLGSCPPDGEVLDAPTAPLAICRAALLAQRNGKESKA